MNKDIVTRQESEQPPSYIDAVKQQQSRITTNELPTVQQRPPPAYNIPQPIKKENYIATSVGFLNLLLIFFLMAAWISIAAVSKSKYIALLQRTPGEEAFLFFAIIAFIIEIIVLVVHLSELHTKLASIPLSTVLSVKDFIFAIPIFACSITAAVYESRQRLASNVYSNYYIVYNKGAFGAAAFFGFLVVILYMVHCVLSSKRANSELHQQQQQA